MGFPRRFDEREDAESINPDEAVRATDEDASLSRLSAVQKGYLVDPFVSAFIRGRPHPNRAPLINVGTHARTQGIDALVNEFLRRAGSGRGQVVSLGAGSDTRFWRIRSNPDLSGYLKTYIELDFAEITSSKARCISKSPLLKQHVTGMTTAQGGTLISSDSYHLIPADLRNPFPPAQVPQLLDPTLPILFIAECLFVYLAPEVGKNVVDWFSEFGKGGVGGVVYEMCGLDDPFGKRMVINLGQRGIPLLSAHSFPSLASQPGRFISSGFTQAKVRSINQIRSEILSDVERTRCSKLEWVDEVEEMELIFGHYCITWGWKGGEEAVWKNWGVAR